MMFSGVRSNRRYYTETWTSAVQPNSKGEPTIIAARAVAWVSVGILLIVWSSGARIMSGEQPQDRFRLYVLRTGTGYHGAMFSPDGRFVAVLASRETSEKQGTPVEEIQVWDFRSNKLVSEKVLSPQWVPSPDATYQQQTYLYAYSQSGSIIALCGNGRLTLLDPKSFEELRDIDLDAAAWPKFPPNSSSWSYVKKLSLDRNADRAAVLLQWGVGGGGELRVYDLQSGDLVKKWDYHDLRTNADGYADFGGADISPDGHKVGVSIIPFLPGEGDLHAWDRNVFVLDVDTGKKISEMNTVYPAGDVQFAATDPLSLLTVSADNFNRERSRTDAVKVWDPLTGKLLRGLTDPTGGVHFQVQTSSDGRVVLGYTGLEKFEGHWWLLEEEAESVAYDQFCLWNLATAHVIACSPEIPPLGSGSRRDFLLSPKGDAVLVYPTSDVGGPLTFYELQPAP
jgi:WD40 repeat protein